MSARHPARRFARRKLTDTSSKRGGPAHWISTSQACAIMRASIGACPAHVMVRNRDLSLFFRIQARYSSFQTDGHQPLRSPWAGNNARIECSIQPGMSPAPQATKPKPPKLLYVHTCSQFPCRLASYGCCSTATGEPRICTSECRSGAATKNARS